MFKKKDYTNRTNITASENLSLKRTLFVNKTLTKHPYRIAMRNSCFGNFLKVFQNSIFGEDLLILNKVYFTFDPYHSTCNLIFFATV